MASVFDRFPTPPCATMLGWRLIDADADAGTLRVAFDAKQAFCNPSGAIQGGFLAAMLDDTLGPTVLVATRGTHSVASIDLHVSFLTPAHPGELIGEGRVVKLGRSIAFLEGRLTDAEGNEIARATSSARVVPVLQGQGVIHPA